MPADADILGKTNLHGWQIFQESMKWLHSSLDQALYGRSRRRSRTAGSALVTKDQHLSHGSGPQEKWPDFIWESDSPSLCWGALDPSADVPPRHGASSRGWKPSRKGSVLGLNSEVGGRMKVRVMVRLGWWWGQTVHPPWGQHLSGNLNVQLYTVGVIRKNGIYTNS